MKKTLLASVLVSFFFYCKGQNTSPWPSTGNVGIGTTSPIGTLDVRGASFVGTSDFSIGSAGSNLQIDQGASSGNTYSRIRAFSNGGTAVNNLVLQSSGGNVGIGTTSPLWLLHLKGTSPGMNFEKTGVLNWSAGNLTGNNFTIMPDSYTGSISTFNITSAGDVGIGTTTPSRKLSVVVGTGVVPFATQAGSGGEWSFGNNVGTGSGDDTFGFYSATFGTGHSSAPVLQMNSATGNILLAPNSGNVGIGTTSPIGNLDVRGASFVGTSDFSIGSAGSNLQIDQGASSGNTYSRIRAFSNGGTAVNNLVLQSSGGNVGIGTTTPVQLLDVHGVASLGGIRTGGALNSDWTIGTNYGTTSKSLNTGTSMNIITSGASAEGFVVGVNGGNSSFEIQSSNSQAFFRGNVGIGTTDPKGYKLAVAGDAIAESMTVDLQANWPDYAFKKDYPLMPLADLKTYVDKNQHLPEVPTAEQVKKDGINLGEMNTLLMKKVEELTLYLIEQNKRIEKLEAQLKQKQ